MGKPRKKGDGRQYEQVVSEACGGKQGNRACDGPGNGGFWKAAGQGGCGSKGGDGKQKNMKIGMEMRMVARIDEPVVGRECKGGGANG